MSEYEFVKALVAKADERGEHVGWQLFPPKRWKARAHSYIWIVSLSSLLLAAGFAWAVNGFNFQFHTDNSPVGTDESGGDRSLQLALGEAA